MAPTEPPPTILTRSDHQLRAIASIGGIFIGVGVSLAIMLLTDRESLVGRMFDWQNPGTLIPVSICSCSSGEASSAGFVFGGCTPWNRCAAEPSCSRSPEGCPLPA